MDEHQVLERDLLLITGIPATGKTCFGDKFAKEFGFLHHDLEDQEAQILNRFNENPTQFIRELLNEKKHLVVTWGFGPDCQRSVLLIQQLRSAGFKWIWFDGNRPRCTQGVSDTRHSSGANHGSGNRFLPSNVPNRRIQNSRATKTNSD